MSVYYKVVGHLEDDQQEVGSYIFNDVQPTGYIEKMFSSDLLESSGYDSDSRKEVYIDFIFKSWNPIQDLTNA